MAGSGNKIPEIMAPVGDFITLSAALKAGADAVYFGLKGWNMRATAKNFSPAEMSKIVDECSKRGVKAYLALNNIYYEGERKKVREIVRKSFESGVNAVIAWDFSVIAAAKEFSMPVFLSTQASVSNSTSIASYYKHFGITRFVLARECPLSDIPKIRKSLRRELSKGESERIEFEVFAHGAMCVSLSGRCFLSGFSCGESANRGKCRQLCRRQYRISDVHDASLNFTLENHCVMSSKDLCTLPFIEELFGAGVDSLKIEGRNRNALYVESVVSAYKCARDFYFSGRRNKNFKFEFEKLKENLLGKLKTVFNRGFSSGFYMGKTVDDWTSSGNIATEKKVIVGHVLNYFTKSHIAHIIIDDVSLSTGDEIHIEGNRTGFVKLRIDELRGNDGTPVKSVLKGENATFVCSEKLRSMDRIYKMIKVQSF